MANDIAITKQARELMRAAYELIERPKIVDILNVFYESRLEAIAYRQKNKLIPSIKKRMMNRFVIHHS